MNNFKLTLNYLIPTKYARLGVVFELLKDSDKLNIADWSVCQGSLEDVFINVVRKYRKHSDVMG